MSVSHAPTASIDPGSQPETDHEAVSGLLAALARITDPRKPRGVRHHLVTVLAVAVVATLAGARNYRELADQAADLDQELLWVLGARYCPARRRLRAPSGSTLWRVLTGLDADELDRTVGAWLHEKADGGTDEWAIALDGKVLRGSYNEHGDLTLFSALIHDQGVVIGQVRVPKTTTETTCVRTLLEPMDITQALVTADAAHTCADTTDYLVKEKKADYLLCVKGNRSELQRAVIERVLPLLEGPCGHHVQERAHGRINRWRTWATGAQDLGLPHAAAVACIRRDVLDLAGQPRSKEIALMVSSRPMDAAAFHRHTRSHWGIENLEHHVRDVCWAEDAHQAWTGAGPQAFATLKNLAMSLLRLHGHHEITRTTQWIARDRARVLPLILT